MAKPYGIPQSETPLRVTDLLELIPSDTKVRVENSYKEVNIKIRTALTDTNLRLAMQWESNEKRYSCRCPINVDQIGYPKEIVDKISIEDKYKLAALLSLYTPELVNLCRSSDILSVAINKNPLRFLAKNLLEEKNFDPESKEKVLDKSISTLRYCNRLSKLLHKTVSDYQNQFDLVKHILSVDKDILGSFSYREKQDKYGSSEKFSSYAESYHAEITLYWGIIGLVASALGVSIEGLTIVVLAHELAHAYTHLGFDRDGVRWDGHGFSDSDHELKEGLAQYYTAIVIKSLPETQKVEAQKAYDTLLPKQPKAYQSHKSWLENATPEAVGSALTVMRRQGKITYNKFDEEVKKVIKRLKNEEQ